MMMDTPRPLRVVQLNVARSNTRMHALLNSFTDIDIVMLQEPWFDRIGVERSSDNPNGTTVRGTVANPAWDCFLPTAQREQPPPRVVTYVRRGINGLRAQPRPDLLNHPDTLALNIFYHSSSILIINIYNEGPGNQHDMALRTLTSSNLDVSTSSIIGGDFNLHHHKWALPGTNRDHQTSSSAEALVEWAEANAFKIRNDLSTPTRRGSTRQRDSIIDLTLTNFIAAQLNVLRNWRSTPEYSIQSDHNAILWDLFCPVAQDPSGTLFNTDLGPRIDPARRKEWCSNFDNEIRRSALEPPPHLGCPEAIEDAADKLLKAMQQATLQAMPKRSGKTHTRAPWWNEQCDLSVRRLREASSTTERERARAHFRTTVRSAKRNFANEILQDATPDKVWDLAQWGIGCRRKRMPPIRTADGWALNPTDQVAALASHFFPQVAPAASTVLDSDPGPLPKRAFVPFSVDEAREALRGTPNNTAPGGSGTTYRLIKWAFETHPTIFVNLFNACVTHQYHPQCLKSAIISIVPKPRKSDMSNPRSYRPIALLECLSKWLEKLVAGRLMYAIGKHELIPTNQFGGRDKSSVIDACLALTHDIQAARRCGLAASALAFDIKGYFDNVNHARLVHTLDLLGFSEEEVGWTRSFLTNRQVRLRIENFVGDPVHLAGVGIPQGSPLSPILSTIYSFPITTCLDGCPNVDVKLYVDDGIILASSFSTERNVAKLEDAIRTVINTLHSIGLDIDPDKSELIHFFPPKGSGLGPHVNVVDTHNRPHSVSPSESIRWLGVYFDNKLNWKTHVKKMATRARSTIAGLRILANVVRGLSIANARLLFKTVVVPVLTFGSPVWYTGIKQKALIQPLIAAQNEGLRWILGAFRTSHTPDLHHIASILPVPHLLKLLSTNAANRLKTLPRSSQVLKRLPSDWEESAPEDTPVSLPPPLTSKNKPTAIHHLASLSNPKTERTLPYYTAPWERQHPWGDRLAVNTPSPTLSRRERDGLSQSSQSTINRMSKDPFSLLVFSDGSRKAVPGHSHPRSGAGFVILHEGNPVKKGRIHLGARTSIFDAEMWALAFAARAAKSYVDTIPPDGFTIRPTRIIFCSDNISALNTIFLTHHHPAQTASIIFRRTIDSFLSTFPSSTVQLLWSPGHKGIWGNERADEEARKAAESHGESFIHSTFSWARQQAKDAALKAWRHEWTIHTSQHQNLASVAIAETPPSTTLSRFHKAFKGRRDIHTTIVQTVTGHGFRGDYYQRFHIPEPVECPCGEAPIQSRDHILKECQLYEDGRHHLRRVSPTISTDIILGTLSGLQALSKFISKTGAFTKPPPAPPPT